MLYQQQKNDRLDSVLAGYANVPIVSKGASLFASNVSMHSMCISTVDRLKCEELSTRLSHLIEITCVIFIQISKWGVNGSKDPW